MVSMYFFQKGFHSPIQKKRGFILERKRNKRSPTKKKRVTEDPQKIIGKLVSFFFTIYYRGID